MEAIRIKIPPFDSALEIVLITDVKCITKQQCSSDLSFMAFVFERQLSEIVLIVANRSKLLN